MGKVEGDRRVIYLRIPPDDARRLAMAVARGFTHESWDSPEGIMALADAFSVELPDGFAFVDGTGVTAEAKGAAHAGAFGYVGESPWTERAVVGFERMMAMPDYRADLDLHVRAPDGEIAAFATLWHDARNRIAILEPVGTLPAYRRMGLGRAAIYELANRIRAEGAERMLVGSDQPFYQRLGFVPRIKYQIWRKDVAL